MNNLFSIIIPTYNRADSLPNAINSVLRQEAGNWELIIIDDGSTDDTQVRLKKYLKDQRIKYFFQGNSGVSAARNKGVELAGGDYVIFLDSDDLFLPGLISTLTSIEIQKFDLVFWKVNKLFKDRTEIWKPSKLEKIYKYITASFLAGSACYRRSILQEEGGFDEKLQFGENYELGMRIAQRKSLKYLVLDETFLIYNVSTIRENSLPGNKIDSLKYLLVKHRSVYVQDPVSYSRLLYQLGYLSEKIRKRTEAREFYCKAWKVRPVYLKAFLKMIQFKWL